jgi:MYXO-CTERM domain-containing protein
MLNQAERRSAIDPDMQPGPPEDTPWGWMLLAAAAAAAMLARRRPLD